MIGPGLSLDQAPPISVPFRFFLTAPLFGVAAGLLLAVSPSLVVSRWTPGMLAATHLFLLGVVGMIALGALQQMLPVVAGAPMRAPLMIGRLVHLAWSAGTGCLAGGLLAGRGWLSGAGALLLASGALVFLAGATRLAMSPARSDTTRALRIALSSLALVVVLGGTLAAGHAGLTGLRRFTLTDMHLAWALIGWIAALILGVSWQVVPMLLMTPAYPRSLRSWGVPLLAGLLVAWSFAPAGVARAALQIALAVVLASYAASTLRVLSQRRRSVPDATVSLFRVACVALLLACALHAGHALRMLEGDRVALVAAMLFAVGFAGSVVTAMLLKIVPFLGWFHLQAEAGRRAAEGLPESPVPTMKDLVPDARGRAVSWCHAGACVLVALAPLAPAWFAAGAGLTLAASYGLLLATIARAAIVVRAHLGVKAGPAAPAVSR